MNIHELLRRRDILLRQARLANVAFAYQRLGELAVRIERARLRGRVRLRDGDSAGDHPWPSLEALEGSQGVLDEYFLDEDVIDLADILAFLRDERTLGEVDFQIEQLGPDNLPRLRRELELGAPGFDSARDAVNESP